MCEKRKHLNELAERFERLRPFDVDCVVLGGDKNYQHCEGLRRVDYLRLASEAERLLNLETSWLDYLFTHDSDADRTFLTPAPVEVNDGGKKTALGVPTRYTIADVPGASGALLRRIAARGPQETHPVPKPAGNADSQAPYMPPGWFNDEFGIPATRLRSARRSGRLPANNVGQSRPRYEYSVPVAMQLWPDDGIYLPDTDR